MKAKQTPYTKALITSKFWETKSLQEMNDSEWEAICDGCAKCCLQKFIHDPNVDESVMEVTDQPSEDGELYYTNIACHLLHKQKCFCTAYDKRTELVPDCVKLTKENLDKIFYMPQSCAYRRLYENRGLPSWHPLLNDGKKTKMHLLGMSVRNKTVNENDVDVAEFEDYIVTWPLEDLD